jgi:hypothetical protein
MGEGLDRHRKYTVTALPFDAFERAGKLRPCTVPAGLLFVQYVPGPTGTAAHVGLNGEAHRLDGRTFPTLTDAERALYDAGVLAFKVHEHDAAGLGLPVGLQWAAHKTPAGDGCGWSHTSAPAWLALDACPLGIRHETVTEEDRMCPANCPGSTVEPVTLDPRAWSACRVCGVISTSVDPFVSVCEDCTVPCERCRRPLHADEIDSMSGLCSDCEAYNYSRVVL